MMGDVMRADLTDVASELASRLGAEVVRDAPSAPLVTYRCGGPLAVFVRPEHTTDLVALAEVIAARPAVPVLVIGRGSNLLVADSGFDGVAISLTGEFDEVAIDTAAALVDAGGAV